MKIRYRLALQFTIIVACILLLFSISVYLFSVSYRTDEFSYRIKYRAVSIANLLIDIKDVDAELLEKINRKTVNLLYNENIEIFSFNGDLLYEFQKDPGMPKDWKTIDFDEIKIKKEVVKKENNRIIVDFLYPEKNPSLIVKASAVDEYGHIQLDNLKLILVAGFIISLLIAALSSIFYASEGLKPILNLVRQMKQIKASQLHQRVDEGKGKDEIAMLAVQFNRMLDRLEKSFEMQHSYVTNVSHEMRTPLTSMNGQIEVSLLKQRTASEYEEVLKSIHGDIKNLITLSNGFLELAETSMENAVSRFSKVRVDEILYQATEEIKKRYTDFTIDINFESIIEEENKLIIFGNFYLIKIVFVNIMDNAYKFTDDKKLSIRFFHNAQQMTIDFKDNGIGIPLTDPYLVLQPFYRADNTKGRKGHGVGLTIVNKIVEMHGGTIQILSEINKGTNLKISLPYNV